jgi:glycosyltransferase involved in cell wall biosynthesis
MENLVKINLFFRKPNIGNYSIEGLFESIINLFPNYIQHNKLIVPFQSIGFINRWRNVIFCSKNQSQVNHITGDIHYVAFFQKKKRTILTIHDLEILKRTKGIKHFIIWLFWFYIPVKRVKYITVISNATKSDLLCYVNTKPENIIVIPNCVSDSFMYSEQSNNKKWTILHIGTKQNKNLPNLIEAIKDIDCRLIIIGKINENQLKLLNKYNIDFDNVYNLSNDEIINQYINCNMLSFVSTSEGFGLPIIEAQAVGRPILTSKISSMPEVAGEGALLVDPYNVSEISEGILAIKNNNVLRAKLVENGLENVKKFKAENIALQYAQLYERVAEELNY